MGIDSYLGKSNRNFVNIRSCLYFWRKLRLCGKKLRHIFVIEK